MRIAALAFACLLGAVRTAPAGEFDYYLLSLSWSPTWCATTGGPEEVQCAPERDLGFVLHGLWPQFEEGWPEYCETAARDPSRRQTAAMADIMGSAGLAWHQWKKHGRCTGLEAADYFALSRFAFGLVALPDLAGRMTPERIEDALLEANADLGPEAVVVTCRAEMLAEVRLCLTPELAPRRCAADVARGACRARGALDVPDAP